MIVVRGRGPVAGAALLLVVDVPTPIEQGVLRETV
jgi:hypothetical protein